MPGNRPIQSIHRAVDVLFAVAGREGGVAVGEIAAAVGLKAATVYKIVHTLEAEGLLSRRLRPLRYMLGSAVGVLNHLDEQRRLLSIGAEVLYRTHARMLRGRFWLNEFVGCQTQARLHTHPSGLSSVRRMRYYVTPDPYQKATTVVLLAFGRRSVVNEFYARHPFEREGKAEWGSLLRLQSAVIAARSAGYAAGEFRDPPGYFRASARCLSGTGSWWGRSAGVCRRRSLMRGGIV